MIRKQFYIDDDLETSLKAVASKTGQSEAEHVRRALREYVETVRRELSPSAEDPLVGLIGLVSAAEGPTDLAEEHDHYLYGAPKKGPRRTTHEAGR